MKTGTIIKAVVIAGAISIFDFIAHGATITQVIVRQQWPWSTDVKVEYQLEGVDASHPVDIAVTAYNGDTPLPTANLASSIKGDLYGITEEFGEFYIDPVAAFGSERIAMTKFKVKLAVSDSPANINEVLYKVFDIATGACEKNITRAELLNGKYGAVETDFSKIGTGFNTTLDDVIIWTGVTNYPGAKTTKLVMRKIPVGGKQCVIGSATTSETGYTAAQEMYPQATITMPEDYWIGVFEMTVGQCLGVMSWRSKVTFTNETCYNERPMQRLTYTNIRASESDVGTGNFLSAWMERTGLSGWNLPTTNEWEVACRAGTTTGLNSGKNLTSTGVAGANENALARYAYDGGGDCGVTVSFPRDAFHINNFEDKNVGAEGGPAPVGSYAPNAYGLYDMHGNILERMLNTAYNSAGTAITLNWVRGGSFSQTNSRLRSSCSRTISMSDEYVNYGFRLVLKVAE